MSLKNLRHALGEMPGRLRGSAMHIGRREYRQDVEGISQESKNKKIHRQALERKWIWQRPALSNDHTSTDFLTYFRKHLDELQRMIYAI